MPQVKLTQRLNLQVSKSPLLMTAYTGEPGEIVDLPDDIARLVVNLGIGEQETDVEQATPAADPGQPEPVAAPAPAARTPHKGNPRNR